jgi:hypothetical protein
MNTNLKLLLLFLLSAVLGFGCMMLVVNLNDKKGGGTTGEIVESKITTDIGGESIQGKTVEVDTTGDELSPVVPVIEIQPPVITSVGRPKLVVGMTEYFYNLSGVKLENTEGSFEYTLSDGLNQYTSATGKFTRVKANQSGTYNLTVTDLDAGLTSEVKVVKGFVIKTPIANKLKATELTAMIATADWDGSKPSLDGRMADTVKIQCSNPDYATSTIQEVFMSVMEGWTVTVTSMQYDCLGRLSKVQINASK